LAELGVQDLETPDVNNNEEIAELTELGVKMVSRPCDVIADADVTFCCLTNQEYAIDVVKGEGGVLVSKGTISFARWCY